MKTAEEFFRDKIREHYNVQKEFSLAHMDCLNAEKAMRWAHEFADQFKPKWISVDEFNGEIDQTVLVKGMICSELGDSTELSVGFVRWRDKDYSECVDNCCYSTWYTNITEVFIIPKTD